MSELQTETQNKMAEQLPNELWRKILETTLSSNQTQHRLTYKDICCISITSKRLYNLSNENSLWSTLLSLDFPNEKEKTPFNKNSNKKAAYRIKFERDKARRKAAHMRAVLRVESRVLEHSRRVDELERKRIEEVEKGKGVVSDLAHLHHVRQASVALNVWQPEIVRGRQKQIVEQCPVPVDSRINSLEMELKLCKQQIVVFDKAYRDEKRRLEVAKEQLTSMKYHPLQDYTVVEHRAGDHIQKRKKLKRCTAADPEQSEKS